MVSTALIKAPLLLEFIENIDKTSNTTADAALKQVTDKVGTRWEGRQYCTYCRITEL